jgi:hypothetical protein
MKLSELLMHVQNMKEICEKHQISLSNIDVCFVPDVLKFGNEVIKNKKTITSTHLNALAGELLLFDAASWEQFQKSLQ